MHECIFSIPRPKAYYNKILQWISPMGCSPPCVLCYLPTVASIVWIPPIVIVEITIVVKARVTIPIVIAIIVIMMMPTMVVVTTIRIIWIHNITLPCMSLLDSQVYIERHLVFSNTKVVHNGIVDDFRPFQYN